MFFLSFFTPPIRTDTCTDSHSGRFRFRWFLAGLEERGTMVRLQPPPGSGGSHALVHRPHRRDPQLAQVV